MEMVGVGEREDESASDASRLTVAHVIALNLRYNFALKSLTVQAHSTVFFLPHGRWITVSSLLDLHKHLWTTKQSINQHRNPQIHEEKTQTNQLIWERRIKKCEWFFGNFARGHNDCITLLQSEAILLEVGNRTYIQLSSILLCTVHTTNVCKNVAATRSTLSTVKNTALPGSHKYSPSSITVISLSLFVSYYNLQ